MSATVSSMSLIPGSAGASRPTVLPSRVPARGPAAAPAAHSALRRSVPPVDLDPVSGSRAPEVASASACAEVMVTVLVSSSSER